MARKGKSGYYVRGEFIERGSEEDQALQAERRGAGPSKTALKAHSTRLQKMGVALLELKPGERQTLHLPERLEGALEELSRIRQFEGQRRQRQYIGKLMRKLDEAQLAVIEEALLSRHQQSAAQAERLHAAERWRERLLGSDDALTEWASQFTAAELQPLRALIRKARQEEVQLAQQQEAGVQGRHGRAYRELFQLIERNLGQTAELADTHLEDKPNEQS